MIQITLVRHGEANTPDNSLSPSGREESLRVAKSLVGKVAAKEIWHSGKLRAKQTAEILGEVLGLPLLEKPFLLPNEDPEVVKQEIMVNGEDLMIVSHLPLLPSLLNLLTGEVTDGIFHPSKAITINQEFR